jgi:uncharacterized Zn finger protein
MTHEAGAAYRCPQCGATTALVMPQPVLREGHVALKCLQCAHVVHMPRHRLPGATAPRGSTQPLE